SRRASPGWARARSRGKECAFRPVRRRRPSSIRAEAGGWRHREKESNRGERSWQPPYRGITRITASRGLRSAPGLSRFPLPRTGDGGWSGLPRTRTVYFKILAISRAQAHPAGPILNREPEADSASRPSTPSEVLTPALLQTAVRRLRLITAVNTGAASLM